MDGFDVLNELLARLNYHREFDNAFLPDDQKLPMFEPLDVVQMANEEPEKLMPLIQELRDMPESMVASDIADKSIESYLQALHDEWRFIPSEYTLQLQDFNKIDKYFERKVLKKSLSAIQKTAVNSLTMTAEDFTVASGNFKYDHDAVNAFNI